MSGEPARCLDDLPGCRNPTKPIATCLGNLLCKHPDNQDGTPNCGTDQCPAVNPPEQDS